MNWYKFLKAIFGRKTADKLTNYQYWRMPDAENVDPPRITNKVTSFSNVEWPDWQVKEEVSYRGKPMKDGVMTGRPMQWGKPQKRTISWGYAEYGIKNFAKLPLPASDWYWKTGHPVPMYDKHCIVREPNSNPAKIFHETIQLDENVDPNNLLTNNALGWGRFIDGELVEGTYSTAPDIAAHPYVWTPWSKQNPHRLSLTVTDYVGADGELTTGVAAGSLVCLDRNSESYKKMIALGGECAAIAEAAAEFGAIVIDRGGSPSLAIQPGKQWERTNITELLIHQGDFIYAKEA